jgi:hypothetical protein
LPIKQALIHDTTYNISQFPAEGSYHYNIWQSNSHTSIWNTIWLRGRGRSAASRTASSSGRCSSSEAHLAAPLPKRAISHLLSRRKGRSSLPEHRGRPSGRRSAWYDGRKQPPEVAAPIPERWTHRPNSKGGDLAALLQKRTLSFRRRCRSQRLRPSRRLGDGDGGKKRHRAGCLFFPGTNWLPRWLHVCLLRQRVTRVYSCLIRRCSITGVACRWVVRFTAGSCCENSKS